MSFLHLQGKMSKNALDVEITNLCNKNCSFCHGTDRMPRRMTVEEFRQITQMLQGVTQYLYFHLMGEPLTHPQLPAFLSHAVAEGYKPIITTNGTLLPQRGEELLSAGIYKVNISVHSFEDGSQEDYLSYINGCLDFADRASAAGVLTVLRLWNDGYDAGRNLDTQALLRQRFGNDWHVGRRGIRIKDKLYLEHGQRFAWPDLSAQDYGSCGFCYGLKDQFGILCDGTVVPCCLDSDGILALGNLFETPLEEILNAPRAAAIREGFAHRRVMEPLCRRCGYAQRFQKK